MPSDFISVIPAGLLPFPGTCRYCGSNQRDCVDFGINTEYDGATLICTLCFMAEIVKVEQLQLVPFERIQQLSEANADLMLQMAATDMLKEKLRGDVLDLLDNYSSAVSGTSADHHSVPESVDADSARLF